MAKDDDLTARLGRLKQQQEDARREVDRLEGRRGQLLQQLSDQFGVNSLEEGQAKLASLRKDIERRRSRLERLIEDLEAQINGGR